MGGEDRSLTLGIDLGGSKVYAALVDGAGRVVAADRRPTPGPDQGPDAALAAVLAAAAAVRGAAGATPVAAGVGVAGQVDPASGLVWHAPNLGWRDVPLGARLRAALGLPVTVLGDVQAAAYGEWRHGAGQGVSDLVCLYVGTGVGGGIVAGGRFLTGCSGTAGEVGHLKIDLAGRPCTCGGRGCVEAYAGGWAIARRARELAAADPAGAARLLALAGGDPGGLGAREVAAAYRQGDPLAGRLVGEVAEALAAAIASLINALNPCLVLLGGGVVDGLPELLELVQGPVAARALAPALARVRLARAALGGRAGAVGAAAIARGLSEPAAE